MTEKTKKKKWKFGRKTLYIIKLFGRNFVSLHRLIWGPGWKGVIKAFVFTFVILTALMIVTLEITSSPKFCNTCHYMKPYYESWKTSTHKDVTCTKCHFPPGLKNKIKGKFTALSMLVNYFTGVYKKSKPWAEISDKSCMRSGCHETRKLEGRVPYKKKIAFDHGKHIKTLRRSKKLRCTSCHSQIVQGDHIAVTETTCFLCHFKGTDITDPIRECTRCHQPPTAATAGGQPIKFDHTMVKEKKISCQKCHGQMVVGDGAVPRYRCSTCHAEIHKLKKYDDTEFMHKMHITDHKIECQQCHTEIQHKSIARSELIKPDCSGCHPDFHNAQLYLFTGQTGKGLPAHPDKMYESGLNCRACHIHKESAQDFKAKGETYLSGGTACVECHGKGYDKMLDNWKKQGKNKLAAIKKVLDAADKYLETKTKHSDYEKAAAKLFDARYNYKLVKHGNPVHNINYSLKLLDKAYYMVKESLAMVKISAQLPAYQVESDLVPGECSNCHQGVGRRKANVFGWTFDHGKHLVSKKLLCSNCHSHEKKHGQLVLNKTDCMSCHHRGKEETLCKNCHRTQYAVYYSKMKFSTLKMPNVMAGDLECTDCHQPKSSGKTGIRRTTKMECINCHDPDYGDMFDEWQATAKEHFLRLEQKVKKEGLKRGHPAYDVLQLLRRDGSKGIHNPELYDKLVEDALEK